MQLQEIVMEISLARVLIQIISIDKLHLGVRRLERDPAAMREEETPRRRVGIIDRVIRVPVVQPMSGVEEKRRGRARDQRAAEGGRGVRRRETTYLKTHHRIDPWNPKHPIPARTILRGRAAV